MVLQAHTMYQVGLMESDAHVQFFWRVLQSLTSDELSKFIKFACNQERIPHTCPCRDGGEREGSENTDVAHDFGDGTPSDEASGCAGPWPRGRWSGTAPRR